MADRPVVAHVAHDELLIAAWVSGDTDPEDAARAADLASRCDSCRDLATDLRGLRSAIRALPPPARPRDFRLTPADAERLRARPRWLDRFRGLGSATITRPLAGAMTALGFAGLMLTTVPLGGTGVGGEDRDAARIEVQDSGAAGGAAAPSDGVWSAAAPEAPVEAAASQPAMPAAASGGQELMMTPVPGDAAASGAAGGGDRFLDATPRGVAQMASPQPSAAEEGATRATGSPVTPTATDRTRPALAVASAALIAGGLLLLFVTRPRRPSER